MARIKWRLPKRRPRSHKRPWLRSPLWYGPGYGCGPYRVKPPLRPNAFGFSSDPRGQNLEAWQLPYRRRLAKEWRRHQRHVVDLVNPAAEDTPWIETLVEGIQQQMACKRLEWFPLSTTTWRLERCRRVAEELRGDDGGEDARLIRAARRMTGDDQDKEV